MTSPLELKLKLSVDKRDGESNLQAFRRSWTEMMVSLGKSGNEVRAFANLVAQIDEGKASVIGLDEETRKLVELYRESRQVAADRDFLGLSSHAAVREEIYKVREAYERLAKSGKLTSAELAQAAMKTQDKIRELERQTNGWVDSLANAKSAFAGLAASGAGVAYVAKAAVSFESSFAEVSKVVNGTAEQLDGLKQRIRELAQEMPVEGGVGGLAAIAAAGGQLGIPIEKMETFIRLTATMSTAFDMNAEQAGEAVAKMSNVFNLGLDRVEELGDAVNVLSNNMAARAPDIIEVLTRIGGSATQFGLSAEQSAALAATMLSLGMGTEVAGTGINAMLTKLQTANIQGGEFKSVLAGMGISARKLADDIRENPQAALTEFLKALQRLDGQDRAEAIGQLFGLEYQDKVSRLVGSLGQYEKALARVGDRTATAGSMNAEYKKQLETTEKQWQTMTQSLQVLAITLGDLLLPILKPMIETFGDLAKAANSFAETFPGITSLAGVLAVAAGSAASLRLAFLALSVAGTRGMVAIGASIVDMRQEIGVAITRVGKLQSAFALASAAMVGWEIGSYLRDEFLLVEKAGIYMVKGILGQVEMVKAAWKTIKNPGSYQEIFAELQAEFARMDETFAEMIADAEKRHAGKSKPPPAPAPEASAGTEAAAGATDKLTVALGKALTAAKELGVDLGKFSSQVSPEFLEVQGHLDTLIESLPKLKAAGVDTGAAVKAALSNAITGAKNPAELNELVTRIQQLGESGVLAKPKMVALFDAVRDKAKEASAEAKQLQSEINDLLAQAARIRKGEAGAGAKAEERRAKGMSPEAADAAATKKAQSAADEANYYAAAAQAAQIEGRAEKAQEYAKRAAELIQQASAAADKMGNDEAAAKVYDRIGQAEAMGLETQAKAKQKQLDDARQSTADQEAQLAALETRIQNLRTSLSDEIAVRVNAETGIVEVDRMKSALDALPTEKTVTIRTVTEEGVNISNAPDGAAAPGFSGGGWTGPGGKYSPAGIVHAEEFVHRREVVAQPGARAFLERFNRIGMAALRGYANGGFVTAAAALPVPAPSSGANGMAPAVFNIPNVGRVPVQMQSSVRDDLARALKVENLMRGSGK